jgi:hypothetical protein
MYIGGVTLTRSDLAIIALCLCLSVIVGFLSGSPAGPRVSAYLAGILLFVALVWDIRLVVPVLIFSLPFGPRFQMSAGNLYLSTVIVIIAYAAWLIRSPLSREGFSLAVNPVIYGVLALMAAFLVSALQNVSVLLSDRAASLRFIQFYLYAGLFILIWQMNFKRDHIKMLLSLVIAAGIIEGILGGWQWLKVPGMYVFGTFDGEHNNFSCYVTFTSVLLLGVALRARRPLLRVACLAAIAISLYSIVFSFSRTAYISLGISLIAFLFMPLGRLKKMILIIVSSVGTLAVWLFIPVSVAYRALDIYSTFTGGEMALSFTHRVEMWRDSWTIRSWASAYRDMA